MIESTQANAADTLRPEGRRASLAAFIQARAAGHAATLCAIRGDVEVVDPAAPRRLAPEAGWRLHRDCSLRVAPGGGALVRLDAGPSAGRELWIREGETVSVASLIESGMADATCVLPGASEAPTAAPAARRPRRFRYARVAAAAGLGGLLCLAAGPASLRFASHCVLGLGEPAESGTPAFREARRNVPVASAVGGPAADSASSGSPTLPEAPNTVAPETYAVRPVVEVAAAPSGELGERLARLEELGAAQAERIDSLIGLLSGERDEAERLRARVEEAEERERGLLSEKIALERKLSSAEAPAKRAAGQVEAPAFGFLANSLEPAPGLGDAFAAAMEESRAKSEAAELARLAQPPLAKTAKRADPRQRERERIIAARAAAGWGPIAERAGAADIGRTVAIAEASQPGLWLSMVQLRERMRGRAASAMVRGMKDVARFGSE